MLQLLLLLPLHLSKHRCSQRSRSCISNNSKGSQISSSITGSHRYSSSN
jgi:hypothetical protein